MANYDSNYAIAQEISARIGTSPVPFDSVYSICEAIYRELGGEEGNFDSVYSILLEILPLATEVAHVIDDSIISSGKTWSSSKIFSELAEAGFKTEIVQELPLSGDSHTIYFVPASESGATDVYDEYMYVDYIWEKIGSTRIDLSNYYTKSEADALLAAKQGVLTAGQNISIDSANTISADGYVFDSSNYSFATKYRDDKEPTIINTNIATGNESHAEGWATQAIGDYGSHSEGASTQANGAASHAEGNQTEATGNFSHAEGGGTQATGNGAHAEGQRTLASGKNSHAEGNYTIASNNNAHAEGGKLTNQNPTTASGYAAHAEGTSTLSSGQASHAEGELTVASGAASHAEGNQTEASGKFSHAEGSYTIASFNNAHAEGEGTIAQNRGEHADGMYNLSHSGNTESAKTLHSVGDGTGYNAKNNAFEIMQNADMYIKGVGGYDGIHIKGENSGITVNTVQDVVSGLQTSVAGKQDILTAGSNIQISGNTISATDTTYQAGNCIEISGTTINATYQAGVGIEISGATISTTYVTATNAEIDLLFGITPPAPTQGDDEIWYTSTNGQIVVPYDEDYVEDEILPEIISNTYENGKGVMKFATDLTEIGFNAFYSRNFTSVSLPNKLETIGYSAFQGCSSLATVSLPNSLTELSEEAFKGCGLVSLTIPSSLDWIQPYAFNECTHLSSLTLSEGVENISDSTFAWCESLTSVTFPSTITTLADYAFEGCTGLNSITFEGTTPPYLGSGAFEDTNNCPIYVPAEAVNDYKEAEGWSDYENRIQAIQ